MNDPHVALRARRYAQVDVFTTRAGYGNPVAVVLDAGGLDATTMQRIAHWTNLSETTFVLAPSDPRADFRLRIFTPRQELPFAGHPTVGTTHAVLATRPDLAARQRLTLECAAGLLPVRIAAGTPRRIFVQAPPARSEPCRATGAELAAALDAAVPATPAPRIVDVGARWLVTQLADEATLRGLRPDLAALAALTARESAVVGVAVFAHAQPGGRAALVVRAFCPADGIPEDPVTGSANAAIAAYLREHGALAAVGHAWRASQGRELGRDGEVEVQVDPAAGTIEIGGACVTCISGTLALPG